MTLLPGPFSGLSVIITGDAEGFSRHAANETIERLGGTPVTSVSSKTGLVIMGRGAGVSKMHKARTFNLPVIDEDEFIDLVAAFDCGHWDGTRPGIPVAEYDAQHAEPEPEEQYVPLAERHLVGTATHYYRDKDGRQVREVRHVCMCGHRWLGTCSWKPEQCPVEVGTATLSTTAPWKVIWPAVAG